MDCLMPVTGGAETTRLIRSGATNARKPEIPIIAITANALQESKLAGMNAYNTKPLSMATLREVAQKWVGVEPQFDGVDRASTQIIAFDSGEPHQFVHSYTKNPVYIIGELQAPFSAVH